MTATGISRSTSVSSFRRMISAVFAAMVLRGLLLLVLGCLAGSAPAWAQRVNLAKYQAVQASSAAAGDPAVYATDGIVGNGNRWKSDGPGPHWLVVTLPLAMELGSAHLYLGRDDIEPVASFALEYWTGTAWMTIPGTSVTGNTSNLLNLVFAAPISASRIRFYSLESVVRLREIALFGPNGPAGYALGTDVRLNLAKKRAASASSVDANNHAKGAVDGYADDAAAWKSADVNGPHTLEVDLEEGSRVGSAHLYTGSATDPPISNFTLEAWTGSAWAAFPGGTVVGNADPALRLEFPTPISTARVRLNIPGNGSQRVRELLVFAAHGGEDYPLGTDVVLAPRPSLRFDSYGDRFYKIVNRFNPHSLIVDATGGSQTIPGTSEAEKLFQVLYNLDSDTFGLRNLDTYRCIAAGNAARTPGTAVVENPSYHGMPHELWRLEAVGGGDFRILNVWSGLALETDGEEPATVTLASPAPTTRQYWRFDDITHYPKKGTGGYEGDWEKYGISWAYNWGRDTGASLPAHVAFAPMQHNRWWPSWDTLPEYYSPWHTSSRPVFILGFNEPDHADQANMSVAEALALWPKLEASDVPLVSPVAANAYGGWLGDFYSQANARGFRVDYTAVHWYGNPDASGLLNHLQSVYNSWGRPVWLTEFSCVDWGGNATWTEEDNYRFLAEFLWRAEDSSWLKRYALFVFTGDPPANPWDRTGPRSDTLRSDGSTLTAFGELYAAWDGDRTLRNRTAYLIHNKSADHRLRSSSSTNAPSTGSIRRSDISAQWALVPAATPNRWQVVSLRDGRRLRWNGNRLDLAPPGTSGPALEWTYTHENNGYFFIDHPANARRLRLERVDDANGAPTSLTYVMETTSTVRDSVRWRFIKPFQPAEILPPAAPPVLLAAPDTNRVALTWWFTGRMTNLLHFTVYRAVTAGGPYARLATTATNATYLDTNVTSGVTYRYVVTATDWFDSESLYSREASATPFPPPGTYAYWTSTAFAANPAAATGFEADPDADNLANGLEYAFLTDPLSVTTSPFTASIDPAGRLLIHYIQNRSATDLQFTLLGSPDLPGSNWQPALTELVSQIPDGLVDRMTVRPLDAGNPPRFYRLRAGLLP